ncbi:hypothetical protein [Streptomyces sp. NPDC031705]|uniref:hypothetical protein n=1 Tax=Streptomyces sp. NPDC031705 TaxID=3155729 RepID=UPI0033C01BDF
MSGDAADLDVSKQALDQRRCGWIRRAGEGECLGKILGLCEELWPTVAGIPNGSIRDLVRETARSDEAAILGYLDSGYEILSFMGSVKDVLGSGEKILGGDNIVTDGEWVWRGDL